MKTLDELQSCSKKKRGHVQSAESRQKEEAKVRFVETSKKRKADEVAKPEAKPAKEQGNAGAGKEFFSRKRSKKAKRN